MVHFTDERATSANLFAFIARLIVRLIKPPSGDRLQHTGDKFQRIGV
jgi:hypothetical protein